MYNKYAVALDGAYPIYTQIITYQVENNKKAPTSRVQEKKSPIKNKDRLNSMRSA